MPHSWRGGMPTSWARRGLEMFRDHYDRDWDEAKLRRHLAAPLASRAREDVAERLARLMGD